jgi:hypothetical protein
MEGAIIASGAIFADEIYVIKVLGAIGSHSSLSLCEWFVYSGVCAPWRGKVG